MGLGILEVKAQLHILVIPGQWTTHLLKFDKWERIVVQQSRFIGIDNFTFVDYLLFYPRLY